MMGVGKSTVGKSLSLRLNVGFRDIDAIIEKKNSLSIKEIFEKKGEEFFRKIEEKETLDCIKGQNLIIALGGGAFMNKNIRENVKKNCISIWLDLSIKELFNRIRLNKRRPLLNNTSSEKDVEKLYEKRKQFYSFADYKIDCNSKEESEIVKEILEIYENI